MNRHFDNILIFHCPTDVDEAYDLQTYFHMAEFKFNFTFKKLVKKIYNACFNQNLLYRVGTASNTKLEKIFMDVKNI